MPILDFWGLTQHCVAEEEEEEEGDGAVGVNERMDEMHLSVFHSVFHAHRKRSKNTARYAFNLFFFSKSK